MDFKNISEKLLQSVRTGRARSFILSSSSNRPEVPARAAAAAAVAKSIVGIPEHERLSISSGSGESSPSVFSARQRGAVAEPVEDEYYEKDFDPVRFLLENFPENPTPEFFETKVSQRMVQLDEITEQLSRQVMEHHEEMVKGLQMVTEIEKDLQVTKIICKNARRRLSLAMNEVSQDLAVAGNVKKKQVLMDMLPILESIQHALDIKSRLDSTLEEGNYGKALQMCSECLHILDENSQLAAVHDMSSGIEEWLQKTIVKLDGVLLNVCYNFDSKSYFMVIDAYAMIDDVAAVGDKVQTFFAQVIVTKTHDVLKEFLPQTEELQAAQKKGRLPYSDLCLRVQDNKYRACLHKTLEVLFDVLCSYYRMMVCEWIPQPKLPRTVSQGSSDKLLHDADYNDTSSAESISPGVVQMQNGDVAGEPSAAFSQKDKLRIEGALEVGNSLQKGRKTVWELAARRVSALLSSDAICAYSPHQFLQTLDLLNKFILSGEAFSGAEAIPLRSRLVKQSERYFGAFHRQNLEVLRMMLEREAWQRLPSGALLSVNLAGLTGKGAAMVLSSSSTAIQDGALVSDERKPAQGFGEWLSKGNPFSETNNISDQLRDTVTANGHITSKDEEEEDEDLLADFIDEDSQRPSRSYENKPAGLDDEKVTVTGSSMSILRMIDKYARLMRILEPISVEVFKGLCQLFELYFFTVFKVFGQRDAFGGGRGQADAPAVMTSRLRGALVRISQQLEEQRLKLAATNHQMANSHVYDTSSPQGSPAAAMSPSNFYAIRERTVAAESLMFLVATLRSSRPRLQSMLHQTALPLVEQFFSRTVDVSSDLRDHVYKTVARFLLNVGGYIDRIANTRWELKELGTEHNGYVDLILGEFKQYIVKLSSVGFPKQIFELLVQYGIDVLAETLVEGYSRVRRCTNEGRALMSLDLQVLSNGVQHLSPSKQRPNFQLVDVYIKAFYLPETEHLYWVKSHPEYSKAQVIGLINLVANMNNWKKKTRTDLLEKIETGDF